MEAASCIYGKPGRIESDPVVFADQILSNAEELSKLKNEISNRKSTLSMLDAIEASE